ncbi:MAG: hypothetical protein ACR2Q3_09295 [Woeseiaceae bacterium]
MENFVQFLDNLDDLIIATSFRLRRQLARRTRERRRVPRTGMAPRRRRR